MDRLWEQKKIDKMNRKLNDSIKITTDGTDGFIIEDGQVYLAIPEGTKIKCLTILLMSLDEIRKGLKDLSGATSRTMEENLNYLLDQRDREWKESGGLPSYLR